MAERMILLVEDDPSDARLIQRAFEKLETRIPVVRLANGDDVVSYLSGEPPYENRAAHPIPAMILLDIKLPRRSGFEVLQWLRKQSSGLRRLPVVMLTSSRHSVDINRAYDLGANSYLAKPENASQLQHLVSQVSAYWVRLNQNPILHGGLPELREV